MKKLLQALPIVGVSLFIALGEMGGFELGFIRLFGSIIAAGMILCLWLAIRRQALSPIDRAIYGFVFLAIAGFWLWPDGLGHLIASAPEACLYALLFGIAVLPPLASGQPFTYYFAKRSTPQAFWQTDLFKKINLIMTYVWAALFAAAAASALLPWLLPSLKTLAGQVIFRGIVPPVLMAVIGAIFTKRYPGYHLRRSGLDPKSLLKPPHEPTKPKEELMPAPKKIVAVNGSPHGKAGNTHLMLKMLADRLSPEGFDFEEVLLQDKQIGYCQGCGLCIEKGKCWQSDDHRQITEKLLEADGIILASPVYFLHVPGQMKTFLDRCLGLGHKPRPTWKPGLVACVSAGLGETSVAQYLAGCLQVYGAFSVGELTAIAVAPGGFLGKEAIEARAADLASDLARAIREKRRYPVRDSDLAYWNFMGYLVKTNQEFMCDDHQHWLRHGFYDSFEAFVQQKYEKPTYDPSLRQAWIQEIIARSKAEKKGANPMPEATKTTDPKTAKTCRELLEMMPLAFQAQAAQGLKAIYQFEIGQPENFTAHLKIEDGKCHYSEGPAQNPSVTVVAPAEVWLKISRGELDGQSAFFAGQFQAKGDLGLLLRLNSLFKG